MLQKPLACQNCALYNEGRGFSHSEGLCKNGVLIIGESLGSSEVSDALPFRPHAETGSALQTAFRFLGLDRRDFALYNLIQCQPPHNALENTNYEYEAIDHCKIHFDKVVAKYKPKVILALGNLPLKHLWKRNPLIDDYIASMPENDKDEKKKKKKYLNNFKIGLMRGYILESVYGIPLISSFHPSYITRDKGRTQLGTLMRDIDAALQLARGQIQPFKSNYDEHPTLEKVKDFYEYCKANPNLVISHDIETPLTTMELDESEIEYENQDVRDIDSIQFSVKEGTGIFVPFTDEFLSYIKLILALPNPKVGWNNWKFDEINIHYHLGKDSIGGLIHDGMWQWKWLNQDYVTTGRALQFATNYAAAEFPAWKHLAQMEPENYGCLDVDATLRLFNYVSKNLNNPALRFKNIFTQQIEKENTKTLMQGYMDDIVHLRPILTDMTDRGFPIDIVEREKFRKQIEEEKNRALDELQEIYPTQLRRLDPLEGYKFIPDEVHRLTFEFEQKLNFKTKKDWIVIESEDAKKLLLSKFIEINTRKDGTTGLIVREFKDDLGNKIRRYCRMTEFKPGSSQQVLDYIKYKKYKVPTMRNKMGERETSAKDKLQPLWEETGDDFLYKIIYVRELDHMLNTYVGTGKKEGWKLGSDSRVHAEFLFKPSNGQLSTSPNIQNSPGHGTKYSTAGYEKLAQQFRRTITAKPGHSLLSADWSAFHINTLAFEAEDRDYMRVGRIDPHSFLASEILLSSLPMKLMKLKSKKPDHIDHADWIAKIKIDEETLQRLGTFYDWLKYDDDKLAIELSWMKKNQKFTRNSQAKPAILGMGFGMKEGKFFNQNRHTFKTKAEPERILKIMRSRFPKTFEDYPEKIKALADQQTYLITRYGYIRRFFNVYDWRLLAKPRAPKNSNEKIIRTKRGDYWLRRDGDSANEAIAYLPANDAFGFKKECMRELAQYERDGIVRNLCKEYGIVNEIHDDLIFEVEDSKLIEAATIVKAVMQSPAKYLKNAICPDGLITKVEVKSGHNWAEMKEMNL